MEGEGSLLGRGRVGDPSGKRPRSLELPEETNLPATVAPLVGDDSVAHGSDDDNEAMLLLLSGLSPSPIKKVKRSSGDVLDAMAEDGKVLPELLSDRGGGAIGSAWPKPSSRKQVLTFGASWDNKSDVDFLNTSVAGRAGKGGGHSFFNQSTRSKSRGKSKSNKRVNGTVAATMTIRRHSDPLPRKAAAREAVAAAVCATLPASSAAQPSTSLSLSSSLSSTAAAGAGGHSQAPHAHRRRPHSAGGRLNSAPYTSSSLRRTGTNLAALSTNTPMRMCAGAPQLGEQPHSGVTSRTNGMATTIRTQASSAHVRMGQNKNTGVVALKTEMDTKDAAAAMLLSTVDVRLSASPAGSVESDFWSEDVGAHSHVNGDGGVGGGVNDNQECLDPVEAAHAAVDRLMGSTPSATLTATAPRSGAVSRGGGGRPRAAAASAEGGVGSRSGGGGGGNSHGPGRGFVDRSDDAKLLEELLLDGLEVGLRKAGQAREGKRDAALSTSAPVSSGATLMQSSTTTTTSSSPKVAKRSAPTAPAPAPAPAPLEDEFPRTPASSRGDGDKPNSGSAGGSTGSHQHSKGTDGRRWARPSPSSSCSSSGMSSTPLSSLSSNTSTPGSGGSARGFTNTLPGASIASMTLTPSLWKLVERGETCPFRDCAFTVAFFEEKELAKKRKAGKALLEKGMGAHDLEAKRLESSTQNGGGGGGGTIKENLTGQQQQQGWSNGDLGQGGLGKENKENKSRCRHFHTLCGCRHTRGALKGRLFQTNQLDKARNHQKKHALAAAAAASSPSGGRGPLSADTFSPTPMPIPSSQESAETPSPMPMPIPSSQDSVGNSVARGVPADGTFSGGASQQDPSDGQARGVGVNVIDHLDADKERGEVKHEYGGGGSGGSGGSGFLDDVDADGDDEIGVDASSEKGNVSGMDVSGGGMGGEGGGGASLGTTNNSNSSSGSSNAEGTGAGCGGSSSGGLNSRDGRRTWTDAESDRLREVVEHPSAGDTRKNWQWVAARVCEVSGAGRKTPSQCKMRWERILNPGVKRGLWTKQEDQKLKEVAAAMDYKWSHVAKVMGGRTYKQCRERYTNYLKDGLNVGPWTKEEDRLLLTMHAKIGNKWAEIARHLKDRSENMIKNEYMKLSRDASHKSKLKGDHDNTPDNIPDNTPDNVTGAVTATRSGTLAGAGANEEGKSVSLSRKGTNKDASTTSTTQGGDYSAERWSGSGSGLPTTMVPADCHGVSLLEAGPGFGVVGLGGGVVPTAGAEGRLGRDDGRQQLQQLRQVHHLDRGWQDAQPLDVESVGGGCVSGMVGSNAAGARAGTVPSTAFGALLLPTSRRMPATASDAGGGHVYSSTNAGAVFGGGGGGSVGVGEGVSGSVGVAYPPGLTAQGEFMNITVGAGVQYTGAHVPVAAAVDQGSEAVAVAKEEGGPSGGNVEVDANVNVSAGVVPELSTFMM